MAAPTLADAPALAQTNFDTGTYEAFVASNSVKENGTKLRFQIYPDNTYFVSFVDYYYGENNSAKYSRGTWKQYGDTVVLTDRSSIGIKPALSIGETKRWNRVAQQQFAYNSDTKKMDTLWSEVEKRCPFWTARSASYGVGMAVTSGSQMNSKSIDIGPLQKIKEIADRQVSDAISQFFATDTKSEKWAVAAEHVTAAYNEQAGIYSELAERLDASGFTPFQLTQDIPAKCGAPVKDMPVASDYALSPSDNPNDDRLTDGEITEQAMGVHIYDSDLGREADKAKVTATTADGVKTTNITNEFGWVFFELSKDRQITALTAEISHDDGKQKFSQTFSVSNKSTHIQDIILDQLQVQRPIFGVMPLRIDGDNLVMNIENISVTLKPDPANQKWAE